MKRFVLFIFTLILGFSTQAQSIDLGLKAGANFSNITDASNFESKTGFVAGVFVGVKFSDKFAIQPELLYSQQDAKFDARDFDLSYVNVPIIFKYYLIQGLNIQVGPQFGFVVDDNISEVFAEIGDDVDTNNFDTSGVIGLGYDFPLGIRFDARYNFGLTDVVDGGGKNSVISLALGYSFL